VVLDVTGACADENDEDVRRADAMAGGATVLDALATEGIEIA
jgi:hypothetical protein